MKKERSFFLVMLSMLFMFMQGNSIPALGELVWEPAPSLQRPRCGPAVTVDLNGLIYAIGGEGSGQITDTVERFNEDCSSWEYITEMHTGRHLGGAVTDSQGLIWVVGGLNQSHETLASIEIFDPSSNLWSLHSSNLNQDRCSFGIAITQDDSIYVFGGRNTNQECFSSVEVYKPQIGQWRDDLAPAMNEGRINPAFAMDEKECIYAVGGQREGEHLSTVERYDPTSNTWEYVASLPHAMTSSVAFLWESEIWIVGGWLPGYTNKCYIYSPKTNTWRAGPDMYEPLGLARAAIGFSGTAYVIGGQRLYAGSSSDHVAMLAPELEPLKGRITFVSEDYKQLYIMDASVGLSSAQPVPLPPLDHVHINEWSRDGNWLTFHGGVPHHSQIYVVRPNGADFDCVTCEATGGSGDLVTPTFSPDRTKIAFHQVYGNIYTINFNGTELTEHPVIGGHTRWSPGGYGIAYTNWGITYESDIYLYNLETNESTRITYHLPGQAFNYASWSPDGKKLAVVGSDVGSNTLDIWIISRDCPELLRKLTADWPMSGETYPSWSPDGKYIVFNSDISGNWDIWYTPVNDFDPKNITNSPEDELMPAITIPCWQEQQKLLASDGEAGDSFGDSVCLSGNYAIVGANYHDGGGAAYIFKRNNLNPVQWEGQQPITASDRSEGDLFGDTVWISGDYAIVGANLDDHDGKTDAGSAYIFKQEEIGWVEKCKLTVEDGESGDKFGLSVCIKGNYAIVGAGFHGSSGAAYIFSRKDPEQWELQQKLPGLGEQYFGGTVYINESYAVVGAYGGGAAYVYTHNEVDPDSWDLQARLTPLDTPNKYGFGYSVSMDGDYIIIGSIMDNSSPSYCCTGSAYIFKRDGINWTQQAKLTGSGEGVERFGHRVSISGEYVVVGSPFEDDDCCGAASGSAYIFKRKGTEWIEVTKLTASDCSEEGIFGSDVSIDGSNVIVGSHGHINHENEFGSAYIFKNVCNTAPIADAGGPYVAQATSWLGAFVDLDGSGSSDPDGDTITYEWDLDLSHDSDGDDDPTNDKDAEVSNPNWLFPIGQTEISLVVTDKLGARSEPDVTTVTVSVIEVDIDIKPGSFPNSINMGSHGVIPVAFLTDPGFDASSIDPTTVTLRGEDFTDGLVKLRGKKDAPVPMSNLEDVDGDGDLDLVVHLETEKLAEYELEAICELGALTYEGYVVSGSDTIRVVPE